MLRQQLILMLLLVLCAGTVSAQPATDPAKPGDKPPTDPFQPKPDPGPTEAEDAATKYPDLAEAQKKYVARDVKAALALLEKAAKKHKELPPAKVMLASIHFRANNAAGGKAALDEAARDNPKDPEAFLVLTDLAIREGRFTDATMLVDRAIENTAAFRGSAEKRKKLQIRCYAALVPIAQRWKQWDKAKADLDKWLALDSKSAVALYRLGEVLFHQGKRKEAYEKLKAAKKENDKLPNSAVVMGRLFLADDDKAKATQWMNFAADQAGEDNALKLGVARWHWGQGNVSDAKKYVNAVLEADPHLVDAKYLRGIVAFYHQDYDNAKRQFESLLLQQQNHLGANLHLALALLEQNTESSRRAAVNLAQRLQRAAANNASVVATLGWIYYRTGKHETAERLFKALGSRNLSIEAAYYIAKIQADRGKNEEAKKLLKFVTESKQPFIYTKAAQALFNRLDREE